jgi:hypothetical protein
MITGWKTLPASVPHPRMAGQARAIFFFGSRLRQPRW